MKQERGVGVLIFLFRFGGAPDRPAVLIAVMGITGVGKTFFISKATGNDLNMGDSLEPGQSPLHLSLVIASPARNLDI